MIVRARPDRDGGDDGPQTAAVVLAAAPGPAAAQRLAGITTAGRDLGIAAILLGDWPHGTTCHITAGGLISGVTPPQAGLAGTEAYHLEAARPRRDHRAAGPGPRDPPARTARPHPARRRQRSRTS